MVVVLSGPRRTNAGRRREKEAGVIVEQLYGSQLLYNNMCLLCGILEGRKPFSLASGKQSDFLPGNLMSSAGRPLCCSAWTSLLH